MAVYQAPEGYSFDPASGLWVKKMVVSDKAGVQYDHRYYFNADTGEYRQESFALGGEMRTKKRSKYAIVIIPVALISLIAIVCVISIFISKSKELPNLSAEKLEEVYEEYDLNNTPDMTMGLMEYTDSLEEGGIIQ